MKDKKKLIWAIAMLVGALSFVIVWSIILRQSETQDDLTSVTMYTTDTVFVRDKPSKNGNVTAILDKRQKVTVIGPNEEKGYYQVKLEENQEIFKKSYIAKEYLTE